MAELTMRGFEQELENRLGLQSLSDEGDLEWDSVQALEVLLAVEELAGEASGSDAAPATVADAFRLYLDLVHHD